jgi:hypothetical protein
MNNKKQLSSLIFALFLLSLGGWIFHVRFHSYTENPSNYIPFILGLTNLIVVPALFYWKKTFIVAYIINGVSVIIGTITMAHLSITALPNPLTFISILMKTTFPDIALLLPKLFIAQSIMWYYFPSGLGRMFTAFWWAKHFCYMIIVYSIGNLLWR